MSGIATEKVLGDETLRTIARELVRTVRSNVTINWTVRENVRAQLQVSGEADPQEVPLPARQIKRSVTQTVLEQAALLRASGRPRDAAARSPANGSGRFNRPNPYSGEEGHMTPYRNASADLRSDSPLRLWIAIWQRELVYRQG